MEDWEVFLEEWDNNMTEKSPQRLLETFEEVCRRVIVSGERQVLAIKPDGEIEKIPEENLPLTPPARDQEQEQ